MEFALSQEIAGKLVKNGKSDLITKFSENLTFFFRNKNYGSGVLSIYVGVICVAPDFDSFFTTRKPKYKRGREVLRQGGIIMELESSLRFDVKLPFNEFANADEIRAFQILADEMLNAITTLDTTRIQDFNKSAFREDLYAYFLEKALIDAG